MSDSLETLLALRENERDDAEAAFIECQKKCALLQERIDTIDARTASMKRDLERHSSDLEILNSVARRSLEEYRRGCAAESQILENERRQHSLDLADATQEMEAARSALFETQKNLMAIENRIAARDKENDKARERREENQNDERAARKSWEEQS